MRDLSGKRWQSAHGGSSESRRFVVSALALLKLVKTVTDCTYRNHQSLKPQFGPSGATGSPAVDKTLRQSCSDDKFSAVNRPVTGSLQRTELQPGAHQCIGSPFERRWLANLRRTCCESKCSCALQLSRGTRRLPKAGPGSEPSQCFVVALSVEISSDRPASRSDNEQRAKVRR